MARSRNRHRNNNKSSFQRVAAIAGIICGIAALIAIGQFLWGAEPPPPSKCAFKACHNQNKSKVIIPVASTGNKAFNLDHYHVLKEFVIVSEDKYTTDEVTMYRQQIFDQAEQRIIKKIPVILRQKIKHQFDSKTYGINDIWGTDQPIINALISTGEEKRIFDCVNCEYRHEITFYIPKRVTDVFPKDVRLLLNDGVNQTLNDQFQRGMSANNILTIDIGQLFINMLSNKSFTDKGKLILPKYNLDGYDDETHLFFKQIMDDRPDANFPSGQYHINAISALAIENFKARLEELLLKNPNTKYTITSIGYTDDKRISRNNPIPYYGQGRFSPQRQEVSLFEQQSAGNPIGSHIENNPELSYARAYSALNFLFQQLSSTFKQPGNEDAYNFVYQGRGVDHSVKNDWLKRRVVFEIKNTGQIF